MASVVSENSISWRVIKLGLPVGSTEKPINIGRGISAYLMEGDIVITVKLCHKVQLILDQEQMHIFSSKTGRLNVQDLSGGSRLSLSKWESRYLATPHINRTFKGHRPEKTINFINFVV